MLIHRLPIATLPKNTFFIRPGHSAFLALPGWTRNCSRILILEPLPTVENKPTKFLLLDHSTKSLRFCCVSAEIIPDLLHAPTTSLCISFVSNPAHARQFLSIVEFRLHIFDVEDWCFFVEGVVAQALISLETFFVNSELDVIFDLGDDGLGVLEAGGHAMFSCFFCEIFEVFDCILFGEAFAVLFVVVGI
jgi:hypothetical protein